MDAILLALARAALNMGDAHLKAGRPPAAAACLRCVLAVMPDFDAGYARLSQALAEERAWPALLDAYRRLALLHPEFAEGAWARRASVLRAMLLDAHGPRVLGGPFAGMAFDGTVSEGCYLPRMLGCYEAELHPHLDALAARRHDVVINVGCAEGYYAVGLARRWPWATVHARDIDPAALDACRRLAAANGVAGRVVVGGRFEGADFAAFAGRRVLVVCDVEGFEEALLDPERFPALAGFDVLAELHPFARPDMAGLIAGRFRSTHAVTVVPNRVPDASALPAPLAGLGAEDRALAVWETRGTPTPWAVMTARAMDRP
ncbi:methyltransferase [Azospirillum sp. TSO22-1]|uniref:methyltransferase n=1 Tax=Azospirillum sp. TSO22-1 TaxID=716789 RepID=UPI000D610173|nr:methyltransferase [Azospirillum sp. TSO22-1]PWC38611.1 hypothetical protein TSO221_26420 [Azospirillum sp. TSO22-1]